MSGGCHHVIFAGGDGTCKTCSVEFVADEQGIHTKPKKKRHRVELMLRKVKVFFVKAPRGGTCSAHTKTTGNIRKYLAAIMLTQENFLYPDV